MQLVENKKDKPTLARKAQRETSAALIEVQKQKATSDSLLAMVTTEQAKNQRIIDALYFYDDQFALAVRRSGIWDQYGFIDKEGNTRLDFQYDEARPFEYNGFARVKKGEVFYLIDTSGQEYRLAESLDQLGTQTEALDLRDENLKFFPDTILAFPQLKVLLLSKNDLTALPDSIPRLKSLQYLDLNENLLTYLPAQFGQLSKLQKLDLGSGYHADRKNKLIQLPESLGQLQQLQILDLRSNQLAELPESLGQLQQLQSL